VRTCHSSFIANRYGGTAFFQDDHLFGIVVFVERNHPAGAHNLRPHVEVFGVSVLLVDLDDEFRDGTWAGRFRLSSGGRYQCSPSPSWRTNGWAEGAPCVLAAVDCEA